ncbi:MAG: hypothetical protein VX689_00515, partial [Bacteroidota bacterium]|nr:hypothetical protein [Bacteroidota bacterium]
MKNIFTTTLIVFFSLLFNFSLLAQSPFISLILEEIPNVGFVNGEKTYRLYAELSPGGTVNQMFADETRPHS